MFLQEQNLNGGYMDLSERLEKAREARKNSPKRRSGPKKHIIRAKDGGTVEVELTRAKAIKAMCTECCGWGEAHPKDCSSEHCPLFPFRGKIQLAYKSDEASFPEEDEDENDD
jgi:hypothetical protein